MSYGFRVAWVSGDQAQVNVGRLETQDGTGCHKFRGHYGMSRVDGSWRIAHAFLTEGGC